MAEKGSLSERYCLVLQELRVEALRQVKRMHPTFNNLARTDDPLQGDSLLDSMSIPTDNSPSVATDYTEMLGQNMIDFNGMPSSALPDPSGWGQFASMVSSGLGNLDMFFDDVSFDL